MEKDPRSASQSKPEETPPRRQILVVEDSKADLFLIREALNEAKVDADLLVLPDGQQAIEFFERAGTFCPDLVLLDLNLPKKTGTEVLRSLRRSAFQDALVLIVTSSDSANDRDAVKTLGLSGYFRKPSSYAEFLKLGPIVRDLLSSLSTP